MNSNTRRSFLRGALALLIVLTGFTAFGLTPAAVAKPDSFSFDLVPSAVALTCLPDAQGSVRLSAHGQKQQMDVDVSGLPANTTFTVFVIQLPHAPFGLAWYQGDVVTDDRGTGHAKFIGIFSDETFVVAPGPGSAPVVDGFDANTNPATPPVHLFHVGMWFDSPADAVAANCPGAQTPFNGEHTAGFQVLNTTNFPDGGGPLGQFTP